jgi:hypothetical protein
MYNSALSSYKNLVLTSTHVSVKIPFTVEKLIMRGGIAQLGERLNGIQEVSGSIPLISTTESCEMLRKRPVSEMRQVLFFALK